MLKTILGILKNKAEFMESAELLFEDAKNSDFNDFIILGEAAEDTQTVDEGMAAEAKDDDINLEDDKKEDTPKEEEKKEEEPEEDTEAPKEGLDDTIEDSEPSMSEEPPVGLDNPDPMASADSTSISKEDELQDIMQVTIDLSTNNMTDVVPVTPASASDAIVSDTMTPDPNVTPIADKDDIMDTELDSDIGNTPLDEPKPTDDSDDLMNAPIDDTLEENPEEENNTEKEKLPKDESVSSEDDILEAVSFGMDDTTSTDEAAPAEDTASDDTPPDKKTNDVTSAVLDKVAEADTPADTNDETGTDDMASATSTGNKSADLLKKLSDITNNIESTKKMIIDGLKK